MKLPAQNIVASKALIYTWRWNKELPKQTGIERICHHMSSLINHAWGFATQRNRELKGTKKTQNKQWEYFWKNGRASKWQIALMFQSKDKMSECTEMQDPSTC